MSFLHFVTLHAVDAQIPNTSFYLERHAGAVLRAMLLKVDPFLVTLKSTSFWFQLYVTGIVAFMALINFNCSGHVIVFAAVARSPECSACVIKYLNNTGAVSERILNTPQGQHNT